MEYSNEKKKNIGKRRGNILKRRESEKKAKHFFLFDSVTFIKGNAHEIVKMLSTHVTCSPMCECVFGLPVWIWMSEMTNRPIYY